MPCFAFYLDFASPQSRAEICFFKKAYFLPTALARLCSALLKELNAIFFYNACGFKKSVAHFLKSEKKNFYIFYFFLFYFYDIILYIIRFFPFLLNFGKLREKLNSIVKNLYKCLPPFLKSMAWLRSLPTVGRLKNVMMNSIK